MTRREQTTARLIDAAVQLATKVGWSNLTRDGVAAEAGVCPALVTVRIGTMNELRRSVMRAAIDKRAMRVIAEGLAAEDRYACRIDPTLKAEAAAWLQAR